MSSWSKPYTAQQRRCSTPIGAQRDAAVLGRPRVPPGLPGGFLDAFRGEGPRGSQVPAVAKSIILPTSVGPHQRPRRRPRHGWQSRCPLHCRVQRHVAPGQLRNEPHVTWVRDSPLGKRIRPFSTGGNYVNFQLADDDHEADHQTAYRTNLDRRLQRIKKPDTTPTTCSGSTATSRPEPEGTFTIDSVAATVALASSLAVHVAQRGRVGIGGAVYAWGPGKRGNDSAGVARLPVSPSQCPLAVTVMQTGRRGVLSTASGIERAVMTGHAGSLARRPPSGHRPPRP